MLTSVLAQAELHVAAVKECRELPVAVTQIENDRERVVLLSVRHQEVQQKALAAARRAEDKRVPNVLDVQVIGERRVVWRLERRQRRRAATASRPAP